MRKMRWIAGALLASAATMASAQVYWGRTYDPNYDRPDWRNNADQECWNPRAGHFERVRPGEVQNDLDFRRCRLSGYGDDRGAYYDRYDRRDFREQRRECWNPRARHYEEVRTGEYQDDLDFSRCRIVRY
jgi:hypothetical protein